MGDSCAVSGGKLTLGSIEGCSWRERLITNCQMPQILSTCNYRFPKVDFLLEGGLCMSPKYFLIQSLILAN